MLAILMKALKVIRLVLKHTSSLVLAIALFFAGLSYTFYKNNQKTKALADTTQAANRELLAQLVAERQAVMHLQKQKQALQDAINARSARLADALKQPVVGDDARQPLSPSLKHALNELRTYNHQHHD